VIYDTAARVLSVFDTAHVLGAFIHVSHTHARGRVAGDVLLIINEHIMRVFLTFTRDSSGDSAGVKG